MSIRIKRLGVSRFEVDIRWRSVAGKRCRDRTVQRLSTESAVREWAEGRERFLVHHGAPGKQSHVPSCTKFWPRFITGYVEANRQKPSEVRSKQSIWRTHLEQRFGAKRLDAVTTEQVQVLKSGLAHLSPKTVNNVLTVLRTMLRQAVAWNVIDAMPCEITEVKQIEQEMAYYDDHDYEAVVASAEKLGSVSYLAVLLAGDAGLRAGEIRGVRWRDVDLKQRQLRVQQAEWRGHVSAPKGWQARIVPLTTRLHDALAAHRHLQHERVLVQHGEPLTEKVLRVIVERCISAAKVSESSRPVHRLRHTFGTRLAARGATAKEIQVLMGHKNLTTTQRYLHLSPAAQKNAIRLLDQPVLPITAVKGE